MPLVLKGDKKKVITLTTGFADAELTSQFNVSEAGPYSISKAAVNMLVAKYSAQYAKDGVLFLAISPGVVETGGFAKRKCSGLFQRVHVRSTEKTDTTTQ